VLSLLLTAVALLPFLSVAPQTVEYKLRREKFATAAFDIPATLVARRAVTSVIPFAGGRPEGGRQAHAWEPTSLRVGSVILALALMALLVARRRRDTWFFFALFVFMGCAGLNAFPVGDLLHALPLFDIALNERLAFAAVFALCVLAAFTVDVVGSRERVAGTSRQSRAAATLIAIPLLLLIATGLGAMFLRDGEIAAGTDPTLIIILTLAELVPLAALALLLAFRAHPATVLALVLAQRLLSDGGIYPTLPEKAFYPEVPVLREIAKDTQTPFRITGLAYALVPDTAALYGLEDVRGYEAMTFQRLHDTYPLWCRSQPVWFNLVEDPGRSFLSFLNVKYAIGSSLYGPTEPWKLVLEDRDTRLFENTRVMSRAFVPRRIRYERTDRAVLAGMHRTADFAQTAWITVPKYQPHEIHNGPGTLDVRRDGLAYEIAADMELDGWVVISDSKWPGWRAYIDGQRVETHYANHAFIGVFVPKGRHSLRVVFQPEAFTRGRNITFFTAIGLIAFFVLRRYRLQKPRSVRA
jgi:hypothetical protein